MIDHEAVSLAIFELTKSLVHCASDKDMKNFNKLMSERERLVHLIETADEVTDSSGNIAANLNQAKTLNDKLIGEFSILEKKLLQEKSLLNRGEKMRKAYGDLK